MTVIDFEVLSQHSYIDTLVKRVSTGNTFEIRTGALQTMDPYHYNNVLGE
jgi:hypothetical protein